MSATADARVGGAVSVRAPNLLLKEPFDNFSDLELERLDDDALLAYVRRARGAGGLAAAKRALQFLVFGYMRNVERRVAMRVPARDVEDVAAAAMVSAITSAFNGQSVGEFRSWMHTIVDRRVADYHRRPRPTELPLTTEHGSEDDSRGQVLADLDETGAVLVQQVIDGVLAELGPDHRLVVELYVFERFGARECAQRVSGVFPDAKPAMTAANVHQIAHRFRVRVRGELEGDTSP